MSTTPQDALNPYYRVTPYSHEYGCDWAVEDAKGTCVQSFFKREDADSLCENLNTERDKWESGDLARLPQSLALILAALQEIKRRQEA